MENVWSILCSKAVIDQRTNMVSLIEATDVLELQDRELPPLDPQKPVNIGPTFIQLAAFWYRSDIEKPETGKARHVLIGPDKKEISHQEIEIDLEKVISRNVITVISSFPYRGFGLYHFLVEKMGKENKWIETARLPLLLRASSKTDKG